MNTVKGLWLSLLLCLSLGSSPTHANQQQALLELAGMLAEAINTNDYTAVDKRFDRDGFTAIILKNIQLPESDAQRTLQQLASLISLKSIIGNGLAGFDHAQLGVKVIGIVRDKNQSLPVVRISFPEGGTNYYELRVTNIEGHFFIQDIFVRANGQYLSEGIGQTVVMLLGLSSSWIATLAYQESSGSAIVKQINDAMNAQQKGDFKSAYDGLQTLPQSIKENAVVNQMIVVISANLGDTLYRRELSIFAERHGENPRYQFMLIDHYYFMGQYHKALAATNKMLKRYPGDAAMLQMKATIYLEQHEYDKADEVLRLGLESEPDFENTYWTGITVSLKKKDYTKTVYWLEQFERQFSIQLDPVNFENQDVYKDFTNSREFLHWMIHKSA